MSLTTSVDQRDRQEISDLLISYSWAIDDGQAEALADLFLPDGEFHRSDGTVVTGRDQLVAFAQQVHGARAERLQHIACNLSFSSSASDRVTVRSYVQVLAAGESGAGILALGAYLDEVVRTPQGWRFSSRTFTSWRAAGTAAENRPTP